MSISPGLGEREIALDVRELWQYVYWLLLAFARISSLLTVLPPIGGRNTPVPVRIGLAGLMANLLVPVLETKPIPVDDPVILCLQLAGEVVVGLALGFVVSVVFNAIYVAGQLIDVPLGFGMVNVLDPNTGAQMPIFAQFQFVIAVLLFLAIGGHRTVLYCLARSFEIVPMAGVSFSSVITEIGLTAFTRMFLIGVNLSLPVIGALLLTDVMLGIVSRAVPQINVFIVGFPIKIVVGLGILMIAVPLYIRVLETLFTDNGVIWRLVDQVFAALSLGEGS